MQKFLLICYFLFFVFNFSVCGQTFKVSVGGAYQFHLEGTSNEDPNIPREYQNIKTTSSVSDFFSNSNSYFADINYRFKQDSLFNLNFLLGFKYESHKLNNNFEDSEIIIGKRLYIKAYSPYLGIGKFIDENIFIYSMFGYALKYYQGESEIEGYEIKNNYKSASFFRFGVGVDFEQIANLPLAFSFGVITDIGFIERDEVEFYYNGEKVGRAFPIGDIQLQDNSIQIGAALIYQFNLFR